MENFESFNLRPEVMRALSEMGIKKPTDIQREAIPLVFQGEDVIGQAQTGTGKTAVFGIYLVESIDPNSRDTQAIILSPTRELAVQISDEIKKIGKYMRGRILPVYGGTSINTQIEKLEKGVQIVVGTPGRILDHLERGTLELGNVSCVVIDEADRMLDMGFIDDVRSILSHVPKQRQTMLFSATMPEEILQLSKDYQLYPHFVSVSKDEITIKHIKHTFAQVNFRDRYRALFAYLRTHKPTHTIIFCRTKFTVDRVLGDLQRAGSRAEPLHGGLTQKKRDVVMEKFKKGAINMLVATDLAARGLDISGVSHVINFNIPEEPMTYTHRVGRTGRAGKGGVAFSIVASDELGLLGQIERECGITMEEENLSYERRTDDSSRWHGKPREDGSSSGGDKSAGTPRDSRESVRPYSRQRTRPPGWEPKRSSRSTGWGSKPRRNYGGSGYRKPYGQARR
ncbi:MAG: DEAD/DEAH box helicase [Candidatus Micrarchaeota archaeon]